MDAAVCHECFVGGAKLYNSSKNLLCQFFMTLSSVLISSQKRRIAVNKFLHLESSGSRTIKTNQHDKRLRKHCYWLVLVAMLSNFSGFKFYFMTTFFSIFEIIT